LQIRTAISSLGYKIIKPLLFRCDPERVHESTLALLGPLGRTGLAAAFLPTLVRDPVRLLGLNFPNRVGLAAGMDKHAACVPGFASMGFGFVEVGTLTPRPQSGNPKPRLFRIPEGDAIINRMGFNNCGIAAGIRNLERRGDTIVGINLGKNAVTPQEKAADDYLAGMEAAWDHADYLAINISSPNTKGLRDLQTGPAYIGLLQALRDQSNRLADRAGRVVPVVVKLAPDLTNDQARTMGRLAREHGISGVIATNTTLSREGIPSDHPHRLEAGGLSGSPVRERSTEVISELRAELGDDYPIIGVGGILIGRDAVEKVQAGADLVQIYTGLVYRGPQLVHDCASALSNGA